MKLFDGRQAAKHILEELKKKIKKEKIQSCLAVISVGENEESKLYVKLKKEAAEKIGIKVREYVFSTQAKEEEIIATIEALNEDKEVSGILVQLPLPAMLNTEKIIGAINPAKDVDGFHKENRRLLEKGDIKFMPVLPLAILTAVKIGADDNLTNKKILALVNSDIFGATLKLVFKKEGADIEYLVRNTCIVAGAEKQLKEADVLIMVCGCPNFIKGEMIKEGAILIDAGITRFSDGKVVGDFDRKSVEPKAAFLTPVPGGIGPLVVALLLRNVYLAGKKD
ncbi:MAG: bifunctional 5,10-methylenetetrahydrofolate dehydrogenase/5,10-methenyltetrahydrofolate cyclohydrolase [Candidatus Portnoybacteria bacterium]|nr:bifunctional 5,10-methylenetetrahydrofolate dehydrogenase/5,10-methenyltetrahydrofolate cyclohydrolase [Candidatus Portnoybacteria bacterium]